MAAPIRSLRELPSSNSEKLTELSLIDVLECLRTCSPVRQSSSKAVQILKKTPKVVNRLELVHVRHMPCIRLSPES